MSPLEYHRPKTLKKALQLLETGVALSGGTTLVPRRRGLHSVVDLQALGLDGLELEGDIVVAGASLKLQALVEAMEGIPPALAEACRHEAALNLRNMATLAGAIMSADGRSPLVTALLALATEVEIEPGTVAESLDKLLDRRQKMPGAKLITRIRFRQPQAMVYEQVARSPADRPIVCVAVARGPALRREPGVRVALGGFGQRPLRLKGGEKEFQKDGDLGKVAEAGRQAYAPADDAWASGEYRSHVAGVLVQRLLAEVMS